VRLYRVEWQGHCYVVADSAREAREIALDQAIDPEAIGLDTSTTAVEPGDDLGEWRAAIPHGRHLSDGEKTCEHWLKESNDGA
jgi:hypothetical protein